MWPNYRRFSPLMTCSALSQFTLAWNKTTGKWGISKEFIGTEHHIVVFLFKKTGEAMLAFCATCSDGLEKNILGLSNRNSNLCNFRCKMFHETILNNKMYSANLAWWPVSKDEWLKIIDPGVWPNSWLGSHDKINQPINVKTKYFFSLSAQY